jgi:multisite-specific tRNA:(cytosine-C5)-methyltransferase
LSKTVNVNFFSANADRTRSELASYIKKIDLIPTLRDKKPQAVLWYPKKDTVFAFNEMGRAELR